MLGLKMFSHSFIHVHTHVLLKNLSCTCCVAKKQSDLNEHRTRDPVTTPLSLLALPSFSGFVF